MIEELEKLRVAAEAKAQENELVVLYHLWLWLGDAATGRAKRLPAGTDGPGKRQAFRNARDAIQYLIQDYPESATKLEVLREIFK